jgi:hypothetical protein
MRKYLSVFIILLLVVSALGCTESSNKENTSVSSGPSSQGQVNVQQNETSIQQNETSVQQNETDSQDKEWALNSAKNIFTISQDFNNISTASKNTDIYSLAVFAVFLSSHTKSAIQESDLYTVSSDLQAGKEEYSAGLVDANNAATFTTLAVKYINSGDTASATQAFQTATNKIQSCGKHFDNATIVVDEYNKNHGITTEK